MKYIKFVIFFISAIIIFTIYQMTSNSSITYLALGDGIAKGQTPFDTFGESYTDYVYKYLSTKKETNANYINLSMTDMENVVFALFSRYNMEDNIWALQEILKQQKQQKI